ncbi:MAG: glycosyltransferase [Flavobacterium sp.]|nr:MAG: glycosyltransferase [Flavobacterium sp.]
MAERRKIALIYQYNENWIGGTYYIENLVLALRRLEESEQPILYVFTESVDEFEKLKRKTDYKYLFSKPYFISLSLLQRAINKITGSLFNRAVFSAHHKNIDLIFPADYNHRFIPGAEYLYWIPDFQEHYLPDFFSTDEIALRKAGQHSIVSNGKYIVFSSQAAKRHFNQIYAGVTIQQFVLPFAVSHQPAKANENIKLKYKIPDEFFICSNQFWIHKNHKAVIHAIAALKNEGVNVSVVFTGKENDFRHPEYFDELRLLIMQEGVIDNCIFLGFIDRADQLAIMQLSKAVIQPSLFEGWSTVIEDAKSLGVFIIASRIDVHKEQLQKYESKLLFDATDSKQLADCMKRDCDKTNSQPYEYSKDVALFGTTFNHILEEILSNK